VRLANCRSVLGIVLGAGRVRLELPVVHTHSAIAFLPSFQAQSLRRLYLIVRAECLLEQPWLLLWNPASGEGNWPLRLTDYSGVGREASRQGNV
jgi:hypothetical protein